ncbi:MAG: type II toxin-antitoxin system HipA family toxin YjjJ [Verrucomicrobiota bacterium]
MARPTQITRENLAPLIRARGPVSATELAAVLRVNRTTIVRALADFGDELVTMGATRSTRYALRRTVGNAGSRWPIYAMDESGQARLWAELEALHERHWRILWAGTPPAWADRFANREGLWEGFPFFLSDARPQGFLGRAIAMQISRSLPVPEDPRRWGDDDTLVYLHAASEDLPGSQVVGDDCLRRALARSVFPEAADWIDAAERATRYPEMARLAASALPGTSAGGEQPKFLTSVRHGAGNFQPVLVKFSPPMDQGAGQRWADLLLCEFHAHEVLAEIGLAAAGANVIDAAGRRFLEVPRFDRVGADGRRGVVSLESLHASAIGHGARRDWPTAALELKQEGLVDAEAVATIRRLHAFGELIGNTDMHFGNLSFWLEETLPFHVAPAYDMLPMLWAPGLQGEIVNRTFSPAPPLPAAQAQWREAMDWATAFWQRVAADARLSADFMNFANAARETLRRLNA